MANNRTVSEVAAQPFCFVIGPIGKDGTPERKHSDLLLNAVIKQILQSETFGYLVKRADEDADPGMIGDRVVSDIINADLVVADLTDLNPNALYELGIRHSTEKPTIHVAKAGTVLPFDTVTHRTIFVDLSDWHSIEEARGRLANSVKAIKAPNYKVSNPITQANASFKMRQSEDPRDRVIAAMNERLMDLEALTPRGRPARFVDAEGLPLGNVFLTDREREVMSWASRGKTVSETADILSLSESAVDTLMRHAMHKLGSSNKVHAVVKAIYLGLIDI